jgi:hypothetical protein
VKSCEKSGLSSATLAPLAAALLDNTVGDAATDNRAELEVVAVR